MRPKTLLKWGGLLVATVMVAALSDPGLAAAATTGPTTPVTPSCAWYDYSVTTDNEGAPDNSASYFLLPFTVQDGLRIVLDGRYPDSRYASLQVYAASGGLFSTNGVSSALTDYRIAPDPGSVNPWQRPGGRGGGRFTVTLSSDVAPGQVNTLPLAPAGTTSGPGYLLYRVYLPRNGDFSRVPLPNVTFILNGTSVRVPPCPSAPPTTAAGTSSTPASVKALPPASTPATAAAGAEPSVQFARAVPKGGGFPNADSGYLTAAVTPPGPADVLVIRGRAPSSARGNHPSPWPAPGADLRYWSLCNYVLTTQLPLVANEQPDGKIDYGCRHDSQVRLDRRSDYTFVVGTESQRTAIDRIPGVTFLPFSSTQPTTPHVLLLRDMLANPDFAQAVQNVPANGNPASAAQVMGAYYPRTAVCALTTLTRYGPGACLAGNTP